MTTPSFIKEDIDKALIDKYLSGTLSKEEQGIFFDKYEQDAAFNKEVARREQWFIQQNDLQKLVAPFKKQYETVNEPVALDVKLDVKLDVEPEPTIWQRISTWTKDAARLSKSFLEPLTSRNGVLVIDRHAQLLRGFALVASVLIVTFSIVQWRVGRLNKSGEQLFASSFNPLDNILFEEKGIVMMGSGTGQDHLDDRFFNRYSAQERDTIKSILMNYSKTKHEKDPTLRQQYALETVNAFEILLKKEDTLRIYQANALLAIQKPEAVLTIAQPLEKSTDSFVREQAQYCVAMAYLLQNDVDKARRLLKNIADQPQHRRKKDAENFLKIIE